jgi:hypothetical protein
MRVYRREVVVPRPLEGPSIRFEIKHGEKGIDCHSRLNVRLERSDLQKVPVHAGM